jgi:hypothetical protein
MLPVLRTHTVTVGVNKRVEVCGVGEDGRVFVSSVSNVTLR